MYYYIFVSREKNDTDTSDVSVLFSETHILRSLSVIPVTNRGCKSVFVQNV